ncbi:MAG TPA: hypothetical protein VG317_09845 [Pseudonocardiaceae bacterium]|nr:hypothetical protein [Pseudonocardiaceae bacterium]
MRAVIGNGLILICCLAVVIVAGRTAYRALGSTDMSPIATGTAVVRIQQNDPGASAALATIAEVKLNSGMGTRTLPAGTMLTMASVTLADATAPAAVPAVGATLACDIRLGSNESGTVLDVESCAPSAPTAADLVAGTIRP